MKFRSLAVWCLAGLALAQAVHAQSVPTYTREQRVSRFHKFLLDRRQVLYDQGARAQTWTTPAGHYANARLLDPRDVTGPLAYAIERYDSYLARVSAQAASENLTIQPIPGSTPPKPAGYTSPEDHPANPNAGTPGYDATHALRWALNRGPVWLTPGKTYDLREVLQIPSGARVVSDGTATVRIVTGPGTDFNTTDTRTNYNVEWDLTHRYQPIQVTGKSNVVLRDFRIRMASESTDVQPLLRGGLEINDSSDVTVEGLELLGFPRTLGILRVNSGIRVTLRDNLIHGSYTTIPTRQVTGIEVDNDRIGFVYSSDVKITGNFILGILLDPGVVFVEDSRLRPNMHLGYESDGINVTVNPNAMVVANNSIMDVGEGIDTFGSNGTYRNNHIERAFAYGLKVIHGASNNLFAGNRIIATGSSSIVINDVTAPTGNNAFVKNRIRFTNAFNTDTLPVPKYPRSSKVGAIDLMNYTKRNTFRLNEISEPMFVGTYVVGVVCSWPTPSAWAERNVLWKNGFSGFTTQFSLSNPECLSNLQSPPEFKSSEYQNWSQDGVRLELDGRSDFLGEVQTTDRVWADVPGIHEVRVLRSLAAWQGREFTLSTLVRRGSNSQIMLRDQITDWYVNFDISGDGVPIGQAGSMIRDRSVVRLTDDWYLLSVRFATTQGNFLLTLRQLNTQSGFLDLGETRFDPED